MVADAAGVSLPTASKVLNGRGDVASATRARVEQAARELGYVPPVGRRSVTPARVVDLVFDDLVSPYSLRSEERRVGKEWRCGWRAGGQSKQQTAELD